MTGPQVGERWEFPPGHEKLPAGERTGYLVRVPTYYETTAFRDWFMREHGPVPSELEILNELRLALPDVERDDGRRAELDAVIAAGLAAFLIPGSGSADSRARLDALKRRAMAASRTFRGYMADTMTRENLFQLENVRWFLRGWRGVVDFETGKPVAPAFVDREAGDALAATERPGDGAMLDRASLEFLPPGHLPWLSNTIEALSGPKGTTAKNWQPRSSTPTTPTTSKTAASGHRTTRRRTGKAGSSKTSK